MSPDKQYQDNARTHRTSVYFRLRLYTKLVISWSNIYNIEIVLLHMKVYIPAVGDSGLGVRGSCIVSVEAFLFVS